VPTVRRAKLAGGLLAACALVAGCKSSASPPPPIDAGRDAAGDGGVVTRDGGSSCSAPSECQDGLFCNGAEACAPGAPGADPRGCVAGTPPCPSDVCDETAAMCSRSCGCDTDAECDDHVACNGVERCTASFCAPGAPVSCTSPETCVETAGGVCGIACARDTDCDDGTFCNGAERCDGGRCAPPRSAACAAPWVCFEDADLCGCADSSACDDGLFCDGLEGCNTTSHRCMTLPVTCSSGSICLEGRDRCQSSCTVDADCDDGRPWTGVEQCVFGGVCRVTMGYDGDADMFFSRATGGNDCDDTNGAIYPFATEICDTMNVDEDCDPATFGARDADSDGAVDQACCNVQGDASLVCGSDCDDSRMTVHPGATETCDGFDNDCNGAVDEGVAVPMYRDHDGDGSGQTGCMEMRCAGAPGWSTAAGDCDDANSSIHEGSTTCAADGMGTRVCRGGDWMPMPCSPGTSCHPQPDGTGLCL